MTLYFIVLVEYTDAAGTHHVGDVLEAATSAERETLSLRVQSHHVCQLTPQAWDAVLIRRADV